MDSGICSSNGGRLLRARDMKITLGRPWSWFSDNIMKDGMSKGKVDPCWVCILGVKANWVLCLQYGKWVHSRCAGVKRVTPMFSRNFTCRRCKGNIGEAMEQEEKLCDEVETVREFTFLVTGWVQVEDVRLLWLPEQDVGWLSLSSAVSYCISFDFL